MEETTSLRIEMFQDHSEQLWLDLQWNFPLSVQAAKCHSQFNSRVQFKYCKCVFEVFSLSKLQRSSPLSANAPNSLSTALTWHLIPAWLQPQWRGSQYKRQSQPHSSRERRIARSSAFSRASMRVMPEARRRARRRLVGSGWRKKQSSTSTPSTSRSSSDTSSRVSSSAWAHSTVPFLVSCGRQRGTVSWGEKGTDCLF